jgi:hypothetical protein
MAQQQTIEPKAVVSSDPKSQTINSTELAGLLGIINDLKLRNKALELKVEHLQLVLDQRMQVTRNRYAELKPYFETLQKEVLKIFLELPVGVGLTYEEVYQEFHVKYPAVNTVNLYRRICELKEEKKLWTCPDAVSGKVRFYLSVVQTEEERARTKEDGVS